MCSQEEPAVKVKTSKNTSLALDILDILGVKFIDHTPRLITHESFGCWEGGNVLQKLIGWSDTFRCD